MPDTDLHIRSLNRAEGNRWAEAIEPRADDGRSAFLPDEIAGSRSAYTRIIDDGWQRVGRTGKIVGPLALAATASSGCDGRYYISAAIIAALAGLATYLGIKMRRSKTVELPSYFQMFSHGIADGVWHRYLEKLVRDSSNRSVRVKKGKLSTREGTELSLMQNVVRRNVLRLSPEENRRAIFAEASRKYNSPIDMSGLPGTIESLDAIASAVNPTFKAGATLPFDAARVLKLSPHYLKLLDDMNSYHQVIEELADIYEPALLARYYMHCGYGDEAHTMVDLLAHREGTLGVDHVAPLFKMIPDMQMLGRGQEAGFGIPPSQNIDIESSMVASMVHMYFARTISDNVSSDAAHGVAQRHVEAADMLIGADYSGDIASVMDKALGRKPFIRVVELPSLAGGSGSWKMNLAGMTLAQLHLRA